MTWTTGKLIGFDLETTLADPLLATPVSFALAYFDFGAVSRVRFGLVDPEIPIPEEATKIHGITDEMVKERGGNLERTVSGIVDELLLAGADEVPIVGMNVVYDLTVIDTLFRRFQGGGLRSVGWEGNVIDISVIDRKLDKWRKGSRKLLALCAHYGVDPGSSHSAADDAVASVKVALAIAEKYPEIQIEPYLLHHQQVAWRKEWALDFSEYRVKKGEPPLEETEGIWPLATDPAPPKSGV